MDELIFPAGDSLKIDYRILYAEVLAQLQKDFYPYCKLPESSEPELTPEFLKELTFSWLQEIVSQHAQALGQILYRIDITEKKAKDLQNISGNDTYLQNLAFAVLKREAQKIWLRHHLS